MINVLGDVTGACLLEGKEKLVRVKTTSVESLEQPADLRLPFP
jgi:hypothetical protein